MSSNKQPPIFFKRKSLSSQKSPSRTQSQKEPRQRFTTRTRLPRKAVPPHTLEDDKEEGGSPSLDNFIFYSREGVSLESRASRPVSSVGENEWLNVSDISRSSSIIQNAACNWGDAAETTTSSPPSTPSYHESQNKEPASRCDQENLQEEISAHIQEEVTPTLYSSNSKSNTAIIGSGYLDKKGPSQSLHTTRTSSYEELTQIALEGRLTRDAGQTEMKRLWKLDPSLVLSSDFRPFSLEENNPVLKRIPKRHTPGLSDDTSFPPLVTKDKLKKDGFQRSASFPSATSLNTLSLFSAQTRTQASQNSGRSCQTRLPESFPGVCISHPPPEEQQTENVSDEELGSLEQKRADTPSAPFMERTKKLNESRPRVMDRLRVPPSSTRSSPGPQNTDDGEPMAMRWASSEFLAARVVSELDTAFTQKCSKDEGKSERIQSCIIPNLMGCSNSLATPRMNTFYSDETHSVAFSSINKYSKSMPNLPTSAKPTRRVFVTFDSEFPRATAVNLQGKSEIAARCRTLNRKMDKPVKRPEKTNPGIKIARTNPVQKTVMIRQWVESCSPRGVKKRPTKFQVYTK